MDSADDAQRRWRLVLGRYADPALGGVQGRDARIDETLEFLYGREYEARGLHRDTRPGAGHGGGPWIGATAPGSAAHGKGSGSLDPTQVQAIDWVGRARTLFPAPVFEVLQTHALQRYGILDLLNDPRTLEGLEPNRDLLKVLLRYHGRADPAVKDTLRAIARQVIQEILARLRMDLRRALSGRRNRFQRGALKSAANFDWRATLRDNLKTYDPDRRRIIAERLRFDARARRHLPWRIILCVDQSGSMSDSIIHAAVMATILNGLPSLSVRMVLFDTSIVDVSDRLSDPLETLLSVQLGGGTNIGAALAYCETLVTTPERTLLAVVSDFGEGAAPEALFGTVARLVEARVRLIGLAALDDEGTAAFNTVIAQRLADLGMPVGAMTPDRFARWLADVIS
jgi:hypothetical protein